MTTHGGHITMRRDGREGGFTLLEVLFSILVIGILLGLLIVGLQAAGAFAKTSAERQTVAAIATGLNQFKERFGFAPPLVKDQAATPMVVDDAANPRRIAVYIPASPADMLVLRPAPVTPNPADPNPFLDRRYSEFSLSFYLCGANESDIANGVDLPLDGVKGPGFFTPNRDGTFDVPRDLRAAAAGNTDSKRAGARHESLVNLNTGVALDSSGDARFPRLVDRSGVPIRYYVWVEGREEPANSGKFVVERISDYNIPAMVGFTSTPDMRLPDERDPEKNLALRSARWAIVGAGANGVFGDEAIGVIAQKLGARDVPTNPVDIRKLRAQAAFDNAVEVGQ